MIGAVRPASTRIPVCLAVVVCGLALRGFGRFVGLPAFIVRYGGSLPLYFGIFTKVGDSTSALASMLSGRAVVCVLQSVWPIHTPGPTA